MEKLRDGLSRHKTPLLIAAAAILLCVLAALYLVLFANSTEDNQAKIKQEDEKKQAATIVESNKSRGLRQYDAAVDELEDYAGSTSDKENKVDAYIRIANIYEVEKKTQLALDTYKKAGEVAGKPNRGVSLGIARTSMLLGDKQTAIEHYKICIDLLKKEDERLHYADIRDLERRVAALEATP